MNSKLTIFFLAFALAPGLIYQFVQSHIRVALSSYDATPTLAIYFLGIAPNFLGALSLTAGLFTVLQSQFSAIKLRKLLFINSIIAVLGLWAWEFIQIYLPKATFDWHDIIWTVPGVILAHIIALFMFRNNRA